MRSYREYNSLPVEENLPIELFMSYVATSTRRLEELLERHARLEGYGLDEYRYAELAAEYTPDDEEYFGDSGVQVSVYPPASYEEMHQRLSLREYYSYLEDCVRYYAERRPEEDRRHLYAKLAKVKEAFRHAK